MSGATTSACDSTDKALGSGNHRGNGRHWQSGNLSLQSRDGAQKSAHARIHRKQEAFRGNITLLPPLLMTEEEAPKQTGIGTSREHSAAKPDIGSFPQPVRDISRHQLCARAQQPVPRNRIEQVLFLKRSVPYDTVFEGTRSGNPDFGSLSWRIRGFSAKRRPA